MRYGQSKLTAVLYTQELAHRYPDIISVNFTLGLVSTELVSEWDAFRQTTIWLSTKITQGRRRNVSSSAQLALGVRFSRVIFMNLLMCLQESLPNIHRTKIWRGGYGTVPKLS